MNVFVLADLCTVSAFLLLKSFKLCSSSHRGAEYVFVASAIFSSRQLNRILLNIYPIKLAFKRHNLVFMHRNTYFIKKYNITFMPHSNLT